LRSTLSFLLPALLLLAWPGAPVVARDPLDAAAAVPPTTHRSAFAGYRSAASTPASAVPWRAANDEVTRIGGWRAYLREAQAPEGAASAPAAAASAPAHHRH
jgi:hypothetical protein